jgi:hypothetical protein
VILDHFAVGGSKRVFYAQNSFNPFLSYRATRHPPGAHPAQADEPGR